MKHYCSLLLIIVSIIILFSTTYAQVAITSGSTNYVSLGANTADDYTTPGSGEAQAPAIPTSTTYTVKFNIGASNDLFLTNVVANAKTLTVDSRNISGIVTLNRKDNIDIPITDYRQGLMYEVSLPYTSPNINLKSSHISTLEAHLQTEVINRGSDNTFMNGSAFNYNNIERIDKVYPSNLKSTFINDIGFLVLERGGNDAFKIAAITAVDASNNPTAWGNVVLVNNSTNWGSTGTSITEFVFKFDPAAVNTSASNTFYGIKPSNTPDVNFEPTQISSLQSVSAVFLSFADIGIVALGDVYGFSLFCDDVTVVTSSDIATISNDTYYPPLSVGATSGLDLINAMLVQNSLVLPIEFNYFKINNTDNTARVLEWSTTNENNADYFIIQTSTNGADFRDIATVKCTGNAKTSNEYQYALSSDMSSSQYYRIVEVDFNGNKNYSEIITSYKQNENISFYCETNKLKVITNDQAVCTLAIVNVIGDMVYRNNDFNSATDFVDISKMTEGVYIIQVQSPTRNIATKFFIQPNY